MRGLETYVDSSWAAKFSCSGGLFFLHGCLFFWKFSTMQRSVALSSAEAEYFGAMLAARELLFAIDLALEFGLEFQGPGVIYCDSKSAVEMAYDPVSFKKTKHIMRAAEYLCDLVAREAIMVKHLPGSRMIPNLLTKAVARPLFRELLQLLDTFAADMALHVCHECSCGLPRGQPRRGYPGEDGSLSSPGGFTDRLALVLLGWAPREVLFVRALREVCWYRFRALRFLRYRLQSISRHLPCGSTTLYMRSFTAR